MLKHELHPIHAIFLVAGLVICLFGAACTHDFSMTDPGNFGRTSEVQYNFLRLKKAEQAFWVMREHGVVHGDTIPDETAWTPLNERIDYLYSGGYIRGDMFPRDKFVAEVLELARQQDFSAPQKDW